ncbi:Gfo/Idh/MocA family oxidoreductase [Candidatus Pelagibacter sp.]|nr:Gfo/Idh/MocA family oxidoreductase [Candidatus Pelagibacter sp.]
MKKKILIIGYGSIGRRHYKILSNKHDVFVITKQIIKKKNIYSSLKEVKNFKFEYIIISNETYKHYKSLLEIKKFFKNTKILIEKPIFNKIPRKKISNKKTFVGYNFRYHDQILFLKKYLKNKKIYKILIECGYDLKKWRSRDYKKTYSASKKKGGGVLLDLSHEIDYAYWIFGKLQIIKSSKKKISKLKIDTEDSVDIYCKTKKCADLKIHLNYINKVKKRKITVYGFNFQIIANLVDNTIKIKNKKKNKIIKFKKNCLENSYIRMHTAILKNNFVRLSDYKSGIYILKIIKIINKKFSYTKN